MLCNARQLHHVRDGGAIQLRRERRRGRTYDVTGPEVLSRRPRRQLGGTAVHAAPMDDESYIAVLVEHAGLPKPAARAYATFGRAIREGHLAVRSSVVEDLSGVPARHVRDLLAAHLGHGPLTQAG